MSTTPPDEVPELPPVSPYGPASRTPDSSVAVPPIESPAVIPTVPAPPAPYGAVASPPPPSPYRAIAPPPYSAGEAAPPRTLSVLSLVLSLIGVPLICCTGAGLLFALAGIILGHLGRKKESAQGLALAGLIIGYFVAAVSLIVIMLGIGSAMSSLYFR